MTESEFIRLADEVFTRIENTLDAGEDDVEYSFNGSVLEIEFDDDSKIIVNRHTPNREIWIAARSGGFHYGFKDGQWLSQRDGGELFGKLNELLRLAGCTHTRF
jgi:CyaY protein